MVVHVAVGVASQVLGAVGDAAAGPSNRRHCLPLNSGVTDGPAQPTADNQHEDQQSPNADPEPTTPGCWKAWA